jgi:hypothetical protein
MGERMIGPCPDARARGAQGFFQLALHHQDRSQAEIHFDKIRTDMQGLPIMMFGILKTAGAVRHLRLV